MMESSPEQTVGRREDDPQLVFTRLFVASERAFYSYFLSLIHERGVVEDLVQDLAGRLWVKFDTYDASRPFVAWGFGFARHMAFEWRRKQQKLAVPMDDATLELLADAAAGVAERYDERRDVLRTCMENLTPLQRQALHARYYEDTAVGAIAVAWHRTEMAVYKVLHRAHAVLLACFRQTLGVNAVKAARS